MELKKPRRGKLIFWIVLAALIVTAVIIGCLMISDQFTYKLWYTDHPTDIEALQAEFNFTLPPGWRLTYFSTSSDYSELSSIKMEGPIVSSFNWTEYFHFTLTTIMTGGTFNIETPDFEGTLYVVIDNEHCKITIAKKGLLNKNLRNGLNLQKSR